jgi:hypothetical protein
VYIIEHNVFIDYLKVVFTLPEFTAGRGLVDVDDYVHLITLLGFDVSEVQFHKKGISGYQNKLTLGEHIVIGIHGPTNRTGDITHLLELKGQACREIEERNASWEYLLGFCYKNGWSFSRIDIASDLISTDPDEELPFTMETIVFDYLDNQFVSRGFKDSTFMQGKTNSDGTIQGRTITFGSRNSQLVLQIYDKKAEQKAKYQGNTSTSMLYQWATHWIRFELRYMKGKANHFVEELLKVGYDELATIHSRSLKNSIEFKYRPGSVPDELWEFFYPDKEQRTSKNNKQRGRWITKPWWDEYLGHVEGLKIRNQHQLETTVATSKKWRERSLSRNITTFALASDTNQFVDHLVTLLQNGMEKLSDKEKVQIDKYRNELDLPEISEYDYKSKIEDIILKLTQLGDE